MGSVFDDRLRLAAWRQDAAAYFAPGDEYGDGERNLAHHTGPGVVRVDSASTVNVERPNDLYWSLNETSILIRPRDGQPLLDVVLSANMPQQDVFVLQENDEVPRIVPGAFCLPIAAGTTQLQAWAVNRRGHRGPVTKAVVSWDPESARASWEVEDVQFCCSPLPFDYECLTHEALNELRREYGLEQYADAAGSGLDYERLLPLRHWLKGSWIHGQPLNLPPFDARFIIRRGRANLEQFHCVHYSVSFLQCCLALGIWVRLINLHRGVAEDCRPGGELEHDPPCDEHMVTEIWSDDLRAWVLFDVDYDCHYTHEGRIVNCMDIHELLASGRAGEIEMVSGPHTAGEMKEQSLAKRLSFYRHLSFPLRNSFLSRPDAPVSVAHFSDGITPPILWWFGEDMVWRRHWLGPVHVAKPHKDRVSVLTDGRLHTAWMSHSNPVPHWVEVTWPEPVQCSEVVLHWPDREGLFRTSRAYDVLIQTDAGWEAVAGCRDQEAVPASVHRFEPRRTRGLKILQLPGGGHCGSPHTLWLRQVQVFA